MSAASDALERMILEQFFMNAPTWIGLHAASPTDANTVPEIAGGAYARREATWTLDANRITLSVDLVWTNMPATNVVAFSIWTAKSGGTMLVHQLLTAPKTIPAGEAFTLPLGNVTVTVD